MAGRLSAILVASMCMHIVSGAQNLVRNPGFEMLDSGGTGASEWSAPKEPFTYAAGEGVNGTRAVRIDVKKNSPYRFPVQSLNLTRGEIYRASVWVRTENLVGAGAGACMGLEWRDKDGGWISGAYSTGAANTTDGWRQLKLSAKVPKRAAKFTLVLYVAQGRTGTAWFDDVCVEPNEKPVLGELVSDVYRETADSGDVTFRSFVGVSAAEVAKRGLKGEFIVPDCSGKLHKTEAQILDGSIAKTLAVKSLPEGVSTITLNLKDSAGSICASKSIEFNRSDAAKGWKVTVDRDKRLVVDGKPFFPIGVYVSSLSDSTLTALKGSPFNCVLSYGKPTVEQLDACNAAGLKVIVNLKDAYLGMRYCPKAITNDASETEWVVNHVNTLKKHPAVLAWYTNDETGPEMVDRMSKRFKLLERIDPDHPTYICVYQVDQLREYVGSFDIVGTDNYPIGQTGNPPISRVADTARSTRNAFLGKKPFWQVPQIFDWGGYFKERAPKTRAPTEDEMKNMAWQCVAEGANGVIAYAYHSLAKTAWRDPVKVQWQKACRAYASVAQHAEVLLSTEPAPAVKGMPNGVLARSWRANGKDWILAVNTSSGAAEFDVQVEGYGKIRFTLDALGVEMRQLSKSDSFTVYNVVPFSPGREDVAAADVKDLRSRTGVDTALYSLTLHPEGKPAIEKVERYVESFRKFKEALSGSGVKAGVLVQAILGHWPRVDKDIEGWMRTVDSAGKKVRFCPLDPGFAEYITETFTRIAKERPAFIMTDDDVRGYSHNAECFCDRHVAIFNKRMGTCHTCDRLRERIAKAKQDDPEYRMFLAIQREMVEGVVKRARAAINSVDPTIPASICIAGEEHLLCEPLARAIAANGQVPMMRTSTGMYMERMTAHRVPRNICRMLGFTEYYRDSGVKLLSESDTCPHNLWSKSSRSFFTHLVNAAFTGMSGTKAWYVNCHKGSNAVSQNYTRILERSARQLSAVVDEVEGSGWEGLSVPCFTNFPSWHMVNNHHEFFIEDGNAGIWAFAPFGIPFHVVRDFDADRTYAIMSANEVARLSDEDIRRILSRKALLFRDAVIALTKRGFGGLTGVEAFEEQLVFNRERDRMNGCDIPFSPSSGSVRFAVKQGAEVLSELVFRPYSGAKRYDSATPSAVLFRNSAGGSVLSVQYHANMASLQLYSEARRRWLFSALRRLNDAPLPVASGHDQDMLVLVRKKADGTRVVMAENINPDPVERLALNVADIPSSVEVLAGDGEWRPVKFSIEGNLLTCDVSVAFYEAVVLRLK